VFFDLSDLQGLEREAREAKELGYTGKQVIHPSQVEVVNGVFSPNQQELEWAEKIIKAYKENIALGKGAIRLEDKLVDAVHVRQAIKILERAGKRINLD
jgi:Citrate lyase beta subunit